MKWVIGIVVVIIIVLGLWMSGVFGGASTTPTQQSAAVKNSMPTEGALADSVIDMDVASIDGQIKTINTTLAGLSSPTKSQLSTLAGNFQTVNGALSKLIMKLNARFSNARNSGMPASNIQTTLGDLNLQLSNMTSSASTAGKNAMATSSAAAVLQQSLKQLQSAQTYLQNARADIATVLQGLAIK